MRYLNWQCRLYGHGWRHPGAYEVVLTADSAPTYPFQCDACGALMVLDGNGDRSHGDPERAYGKPEPPLEPPVDPTVDTKPEED